MRTFSALLTLALIGGVVTTFFFGSAANAKKPDKDKTPPVITDLRVESITDNSAVVRWTTDEPADSDIRYGIDPHTNINGPFDPALVLDHAIALSGLLAETTYAFCIRTRDAANNKAEACGTFTTIAVPTPPVSAGGGGTVRPTLARISGFAYPNAHIAASLRSLPFGNTYKQDITAAADGAFALGFDSFPQGLYLFSVTAEDSSGAVSARKGFQFDFSRGDAPLFKEQVVIPPTLVLERSVVSWGDDILVKGSTVPNSGVLVEVGDVAYEAKADDSGAYEILINSARFAPGKTSVRVRSAFVSDFGYDYSPSKTVTLTLSSVPAADLNEDGVVDIKDLSIFITSPKDMNNDGVVNSTDVSIFLQALTKKAN